MVRKKELTNSPKSAKIGQIGLGSWGPNILRNFMRLSDCEVKFVCDIDLKKLEEINNKYPSVNVTSNYNDLLNSDIDAVVISTPADSHYKLARQALLAGKHVFVEKPLTLTVKEGEWLVRLAKKMKRKLMVGHLMLYHPAVSALKKAILEGMIGELYYIYVRRSDLGRLYKRENALWNLAVHDIAVILHLMGEEPKKVFAQGSCHIQKGIEEVVFTTLKFKGNKTAYIHSSVLDPFKERRTIVVGSRGMLVFDELAPDKKLKFYAKKVMNIGTGFQYADNGCQELHYADDEPLKVECDHFLAAILSNKTPLSDGKNALSVVKVLSVAQRSLR
jgi:predicted dehydrogenase